MSFRALCAAAFASSDSVFGAALYAAAFGSSCPVFDDDTLEPTLVASDTPTVQPTTSSPTPAPTTHAPTKPNETLEPITVAASVNAGQIQTEPEAKKEATPADTQLERDDANEPKKEDSEPQSELTPGTDQPQTSEPPESNRLTKMILPPTSRLRIAASNQVSPACNKRPPPQPSPVKTFEKEYKERVQHMKEAQREARQLRQHVVSLNSESETAESEISPLKQELERQRLDKERKRQHANHTTNHFITKATCQYATSHIHVPSV